VAALADYNSVILNNVPATALSNRRMEILQTYVRDLGGGLIVVGGPDTYAPGGYFQTPLEETLPLDMQIRDQQRLPQLTLAYVIDRSGSMSMVGPSGVENIELAKEAIIRSIDLMQPSDRAGVISFDTQGYWIAESSANTGSNRVAESGRLTARRRRHRHPRRDAVGSRSDAAGAIAAQAHHPADRRRR
jgi:hypothetical protein